MLDTLKSHGVCSGKSDCIGRDGRGGREGIWQLVIRLTLTDAIAPLNWGENKVLMKVI